MRSPRLGVLLLPVLPVLLILCSCATLPPAGSPGEWLGLLPPESTVFAGVQVPAARGLLEAAAQRLGPDAALDAQQMGRVLDRTRRLYGGLTLFAHAGPSVSLVALGDFRPAAVSCRLGAAADWQRRRSGEAAEGNRPYWEHRRLALEMAIPQAGMVLLSNGGMARLLDRLERSQPEGSPRSPQFPAEVLTALQSAALFAYLPALPGGIGPGGEAGAAPTSPAPIREAWFAGEADPALPGGYLTEWVFRLEEEKNPRLLESLVRLLLAAWLRRSGVQDPVGKLRAAQILAAGREVRVSALPLSGEEILQLLEAVLPAPMQ